MPHPLRSSAENKTKIPIIMHKNIDKIITEAIRRVVLNESSGVNFDNLQAAKEISSDFVKNHLWGIYSDYNSFDDDNWYDLDDTYGFESTQGNIYWINVFYAKHANGTLNGNTNGQTVGLNYFIVKQIIENTFQGLHHNFNMIQIKDYINREVYEKITPIIEHELTHNLDKTTGEIGDMWLSNEPPHSIDRDDIVYALYVFSEKEMNARIGSIGSMFQNYLELYDVDNILHNSKYFQGLIEDFMNSDELKINDMQMVLSQITNHYDINDMPMAVNDYLKKSRNRPYSFAYYIFKNDSRLKKNRKIRHLFETNFSYGVSAVYNFYKRLYDNYVRRIYKACYASLNYKNIDINRQ